MWSGSRSNAWRKHTLSFQRTRSGGVDGGNGDKATPAVRVSSASRGLPEQGTEHLPKRGLIGRGQSSYFLEHKGRVDDGEDRFEDGRLEPSRTLPVLDLDLTHGQRGG